VLRLDWNILFNIINLLILYLLMKRFLFKPVNEILAKRQAEADSRFAQADAKESQAKESYEKYEALLQDAVGEKERIVTEAHTQAGKEYGRIVDEAKHTAQNIIADAREDAKKEKDAMMQQADSQIREMVLSAAAKMAGTADGADNDKRLYDAFLAAQEKDKHETK